jgi:LacI family transcriptional regulator
VPEDVAVVGVDNDPVFAEFDDPPLTSISRNDHEVGRQAAAMLASLMTKKPSVRRAAAPRLVRVPPDAIIQRGSTETLAIEDPIVTKTVRYIREHVQERFGVADLLKEAALSRRAFEYRIRAVLGCSPHELVNTLRIDAAKRLLAEEPRPKISAVAAACGFGTPRRFRLVFLRTTGRTPGDFRKEHVT